MTLLFRISAQYLTLFPNPADTMVSWGETAGHESGGRHMLCPLPPQSTMTVKHDEEEAPPDGVAKAASDP